MEASAVGEGFGVERTLANHRNPAAPTMPCCPSVSEDWPETWTSAWTGPRNKYPWAPRRPSPTVPASSANARGEGIRTYIHKLHFISNVRVAFDKLYTSSRTCISITISIIITIIWLLLFFYDCRSQWSNVVTS